MKICGLQKVSFVDFDGHICATIFTGGCNFACPFCHNAGLVKSSEDLIDENDVLEYLESRKGLLDSVCISGGEPTLHPDLPELISKIKKLGYIIKLDTNGTNISMLKHLVDNNLIDYIAMDVKNSLDKYGHTIGNSMQFDVKSAIKYIMNCGLDYEFRTTIVKEYHSATDIKNIASLIKGAKKYYLQKFVDNNNCLTRGLTHINKDKAEEYLKFIQKTVPNTQLRGY